MASPPTPPPPLNVEIEERLIGTPDLQSHPDIRHEKSTVEIMREKLEKPTIGVSLIVLLVLNTIMFFVGITTTDRCPVQKMIPIYLAVAGALGIVTKVLPIVTRNRPNVLLDRFLYALIALEFIWMILGSYWIYSIFRPSYYEKGSHYCNKTLYLLAFWLLTLYYLYVAFIFLVGCCVLCLGCCMAARAAREYEPR